MIDDYHRAQTPEIDSLLAMLIRSSGATPSLVVISRLRPQLPIDVLNAYGELSIIGVADLQFSAEESRQMLRAARSGVLPSEQVDAIAERAGGWAVGLRLLASSPNLEHTNRIETEPGPETMLGPEVAGYLFAEVIEQQPADVQDFLQRTSILEFLQPDYCVALTGRDDSARVLQQLTDSALFTEVVDREKHTYRYHPLFQDVLRSRLEHSLSTAELQALHRAAAEQYREAGSFEWAAEHSILADDWDLALELLHGQAITWMLDDQLPSLETWTGRFPLDVLLRDSLLTFCRGWALVRLGHPQEAEQLIELARRRADFAEDPFFETRLDSLTAYNAMLRGDTLETLRVLGRWLPDFPRLGTFEHLAFMVMETLSYLFAGQPQRGSVSLDRARQTIESSGKTWIDSLESSFRGRILLEYGQHAKAKALFKEAIHLGERTNAQPLHYAHLLHSQACLELLELRSARSNALRCLDLAGTIGTSVHTSPALQVLADVAIVRGDRLEAEQHIRQAIAVARQHELSGQLRDAEARRAHYLIANEDAEGATQWANSRLGRDRSVWDYTYFQENAVLARYLIVAGRVDDAQSLIAPLFEEARTNHRRRDEHEMAILGAFACWRAGDQLSAVAQFRPVLHRAMENTWILSLAQDVHLLSPLLERFVGDTELGGFVNTLLRDRRDRQQMQIVLDSTGSPLTPRERDMLSGLLTGKSNRELADELYISEYTVKRHLSNIYGKLGGFQSRPGDLILFQPLGQLSDTFSPDPLFRDSCQIRNDR